MASAAAVSESGEQWNYLSVYLVLSVAFCTDQVFSMLMAFYPGVLKERGLSATLTGVLFGSFAFASVISSAFITEVSRRTGSFKTLTFAVVVLTTCTFAFAFTDSIENNHWYFCVCVALRVVQGLSGGCIDVVGLGIIMRSVPTSKAGDATAWVESVRALGVLCGPLVGSLLYSWEGYSAPFLLSTLLVGSVAATMVMSGFSSSITNETTSKGNETTMTLLQSPVVKGCICACLVGVAALTFVEPTLENFLNDEPFNLTNVQVSLVYFSLVFTFALASACSGEIAEVYGNIPTMSFGFMLIGFGYLVCAPPQTMTGPLSIFAFLYSELYATHQIILGLCLAGLGTGVTVAPFTTLMVNEAAVMGLDVSSSSDAIGTFSAMAYSLGAALGPSSSGFLVDILGFRRSCALFGYCIIAVSIFLSSYVGGIVSNRKQTSSLDTHDNNTHESAKLITGDEKTSTYNSLPGVV